jgi:predicted transcriptional regulator
VAMVRISEETRDKVRELADRSGTSMQAVLDEAVERHRRACFFAELDAAYADLRAQPEAWAEELAERAQMGGTLADDLAPDE